MSKPVRPNFKPQRRPTFIKAWRKHRGDMSQEKLVERLMTEAEYQVSPGQLSRIERGEQAYTQDLLEALATVFSCAPEDLLMRDPTKEDAAWSLLESLKPTERQRALRLLRAIADEAGAGEQATGTGG